MKVYKKADDGSTCLKLCEFGLATEVGNHLLHDVCGTPMYMAPEIINKTGYVVASMVTRAGQFGKDPFRISIRLICFFTHRSLV